MKIFFRLLEFLKTTLIYLVFPPMCPICREIADERDTLCESCREKIFNPNEKIKLPANIDGVFRLTKYRGGTQKLLGKMKFENNLKVLPALKKILDLTSARPEFKNFLAQIDAATFVPLHEKRFRERGYNQTELLFRDKLEEFKIPVENFLIRKKATPKLFDLNPVERKKVLRGAFFPAGDFDLSGKKILLGDDIYTTGSTASECAGVLKKIGAAKVYVIAFASDS